MPEPTETPPRPSLVDRITGLRPEERSRVWRGALVYFILMTAYYALRPARDAFGISGGSRALPWLFTATFVSVLVVTPIYGWAASKFGRTKLIPIVYRLCAVVLVLFFGAMNLGYKLEAGYAFFVWISVFNLFAISLLWSVMSDSFDEPDARRVFGVVAFGGSVGALLGPTIAAATAELLSAPYLLLFAAVLLEVGIVLGRPLWAMPGGNVETPTASSEPLGGSAFEGFAQVLRSRQLQSICLYLLLMTTVSTVAYFEQGHILEAAFDDDERRTTVLAGIDIAVNAITMVCQAVFTGRILKRFGVTAALTILPLVCALGLAGLAAAPVLIVLAAFQILRRTTNYAMSKPAREVLYTAVTRSERYKAKAFVDTVVYRGGDALAGWAFAGLLGLGLGLSGIALASVPVAVLWVASGLWLGRRHSRLDTGATPDQTDETSGPTQPTGPAGEPGRVGNRPTSKSGENSPPRP